MDRKRNLMLEMSNSVDFLPVSGVVSARLMGRSPGATGGAKPIATAGVRRSIVSFLFVVFCGVSGFGLSATAAPDGSVLRVTDRADGIEVSFELPRVRETIVQRNGQNFTHLSIPDGGTAGEVGHPLLPFRGFFVEVPYGVDLNVRMIDQTVSEQKLAHPLVPVQPHEMEDDPPPPFTLDRLAYASREYLPASPVELRQIGFIRGHRVVFVKIQPFQYRAATQDLRTDNALTFSIDYSGRRDRHETRRKARLYSPFYQPVLKDLLKNWQDHIVPESHQFELAFGADYLILVTESLYNACETGGENAIDEFAAWKTMTGYQTWVSRFPDAVTSDDVEAYLQVAYDMWSPAPTYVLIIGDDDMVPGSSDTYPFDSDHPYTLLDATEDSLADVRLGRLSVVDGDQCQTVLDKIMTYATEPSLYENWYARSALLSYFQDGTDGEPDCVADKWYVDITSYVHSFLEDIEDQDVTTIMATNNYCGTYYPRDATYPHMPEFEDPLPYADDDFLFSSDSAQQQSDIAEAINDGAGLVIHRDHVLRCAPPDIDSGIPTDCSVTYRERPIGTWKMVEFLGCKRD